MVYTDAILAIGTLFSVGLLADYIGRRTRIPRVTLLLGCGLIAGAFGLLPENLAQLTETITITALTFVSFLLGGSLKLSNLKAHGLEILVISMAVVLCTLAIVFGGLLLFGVAAPLALVLASIATATAPAATLDVIRQSKVCNDFTRVLQGIVAIDDAWGLIFFSLCLSLATQLAGSDNSVPVSALYDIGGAVVLGLAIGAPAAFLTGRIDSGEPLLIEALAIAFLTAGLASWLHVSFLIAGMVVGTVIVNFAAHHNRAFHEIEHIQWPFMILFFILAGTSLEISAVEKLGALGLVFISLRVVSRLIGGWAGAKLCGTPPEFRPALRPGTVTASRSCNWYGPARVASVAVLARSDHGPYAGCHGDLRSRWASGYHVGYSQVRKNSIS